VTSRFADAVGRSAEPRVWPVERGHIARFAEAIGEENPIYFDENAARVAGHPAIPAPPTFAAALRPNDPREGLDFDWRKLLHAEQELAARRPLYAGDTITVGAKVAEVWVKEGKSGVMDFIAVDVTGTDQHGAEVFVMRSMVAIRR
jgi:acyl dehydratase